MLTRYQVDRLVARRALKALTPQHSVAEAARYRGAATSLAAWDGAPGMIQLRVPGWVRGLPGRSLPESVVKGPLWLLGADGCVPLARHRHLLNRPRFPVPGMPVASGADTCPARKHDWAGDLRFVRASGGARMFVYQTTQTILSSTRQANQHHVMPAGERAGQPRNRVFERYRPTR